MKKVETLIEKLKKIHDVYLTANNEQRIRLFDASQPTIESLVGLGFRREVLESAVMFGKEFLLSVGITRNTQGGVWILFFV